MSNERFIKLAAILLGRDPEDPDFIAWFLEWRRLAEIRRIVIKAVARC